MSDIKREQQEEEVWKEGKCGFRVGHVVLEILEAGHIAVGSTNVIPRVESVRVDETHTKEESGEHTEQRASSAAFGELVVERSVFD